MGVPTFYRYVHDRWPRCISDYVERPAESAEWNRRSNPNAVEFDCLYLDFNGIVHNATHPQDRPAPPNRQAMMLEIFRLVDRIVAAARPRRLLYIAVDGVAPRAKMDQQRARRFLAALERRGGAAKAVRDGGGDVPGTDHVEAAAGSALADGGGDGADRGAFDHNAITPGSAFMAELGACLRYYCAARTGSCAAWQGLCVILSDSTVAGEGEHKIMDFIRQRLLQPGYDPDTRHCVYGLDADLVMLGLATHELRFHILREWVPVGAERFRVTCDVCGHDGHARETCPGYRAAQASGDAAQQGQEARPVADKRLELLDVSLAREYILYVLRPEAFMRPEHSKHLCGSGRAQSGRGQGVGGTAAPAAAAPAVSITPWWDAERILDEFVLLTFLIGNDFLPPLPHLAIRSGGLDVVLDIYRQARASLGGYLLSKGRLQLGPLARFFAALAAEEEQTIRRRDGLRAEKTAHRKRKPAGGGGGAFADLARPDAVPGACAVGQEQHDTGAEALAGEAMRGPAASASPPSVSPVGQATGVPMLVEATAGWRAGEYASRFGNEFDRAKLRRLCLAHVRGLAWCAHYYFYGCPDWRWHFGHHYAPYAADLAHIAAELAEQEQSCASDQTHESGGVAAPAAPPVPGSVGAAAVISAWGEDGPLRPLQQLAAVLPPGSAALLPESYQQLICSEESALAAYFPSDVPLDARGCKHAWQAVPLLPFVPLDLLLPELDRLPLRSEEERRNAAGRERVYAHPQLARRMCPRLQLVPPACGKGGDGSAAPKWHAVSSSAPIYGRARQKAHTTAKAGLIRAPLGLKLPALDATSSACLEMRAPKRRPQVAALLPGATPLGPRLTLIELSTATRGRVTAEAMAGVGTTAPAAKGKKSTATAAEKALALMGGTVASSTVNAAVQPGTMFGFTF
jgi:5'-3' exoribonuclease 2